MIGVPSRGRAGKSATLDALRGRDDVVVVVAPDEMDAYFDTYGFVTIPQQGKGIGDARQTLLTFARANRTGPNFRHRAWVDPFGVHMDVNIRNFVRVDPAAPINYWDHLKEDLAVVLDALAAGWHTVLFNQFVFDSPQMGTTEGGCWDDYLAGNLDAACMALVSKYPGVVSLKLDPKSGSLSNRINWKAARP